MQTHLSLILPLPGMSDRAIMSSIAGVLRYPDRMKGIPQSLAREPILEGAQHTPAEKKHRDHAKQKSRHKRHAGGMAAGTLLEPQG